MRGVRRFKYRKIFLALVVLGGIFLLGAATLFVLIAAVETPNIGNFKNRQVAQSTKIYDATGKILLWEIHGEERRTVVLFENIALAAKNATIAIEDSSFYSHGGVNIFSIARAVFADLFLGKRQGASTITQQLVKNTLLTPEQTLNRKVKEVIIALKLEADYSKDEILSLYLNEIPYGANAYGIEAASETYFGKSASGLTLAEAAYLAAMPKAPSFYSPYGNHRKDLEERKNLVLERMRSLNFIREDEYQKAKAEQVTFQPQKRMGLLAPHFVMYVRDLLNDRYGEDVVERGGLKVVTTLNMSLQQKAEEIVSRYAKDNEKKFRASNAGLIALDPKTGRILAMVGSRDYFDIAHEGNFNVTLAHRQPGSAFKPMVYATAFKRGYTPETVVFDLETNFAVSGPDYIPQNYDERFRGPVSLREALAQSLNVPSVKVLYLAGVDNSIRTAQDLGISSLADPGRYGLTLVLGGGEVSPLELTSAYGVLAARGARANTHSILEVRDKNDKVLEQESVVTRQVIDANITDLVSSILSDNKARTPAFGASSPLYFSSGNVAAKTGTTNDYRDAWTIGYSPNLVVGTWAGNNDNSSMTKNVAGFIVAPMWREFMDTALPLFPQESFAPPESSRAQKPILRGVWKGSRISGESPDQRVIQEVRSILYWVDKNNPDGPVPEHPEQDPQFPGWENPVRRWALEHGLRDNELVADPRIETPEINFDILQSKLSVHPGENIIIYPKISHSEAISEINVFVDGEFLKSLRGAFDIITFSPAALGLQPGTHALTLRVYESSGNRQEKSIDFTIEAP